MFWGLIMEPNKRYTQTVEKSFHVSMASLDASTADDEIVQVLLCYENRNYLLCSLKKGSTWQVPLDLNFQEGTKIAFTSNGRGHVHLTGYLIPEEEDLDLDELEEEEEEDDEDVPQLVSKQPKRKAIESPKEAIKVKRIKQDNENEEESSDDDEFEIDGHNDDDDDDDDDEDDSEDEEEKDDELDDDEDDSDSVEEEEKVIKPQQQQKQQQQQKKKQNQQQQQQSKKQENQKLVNGKEPNQEQAKQQKKNKGEKKQQTVQNDQKKKVVEGGVQVEDLKVGNGAPAKAGKLVSVYYVGRLKNGKKFDATTQGDGFKFRLGNGEVIKGWDVGIMGMKVGGKRRITIPPGMAYGAKGSPPVIPGNSTLSFEVDLRNVH